MKPCPFCGHKETVVCYRAFDKGYVVKCLYCQARGPLIDTRDKAREWWDERKEYGTLSSITGESNEYKSW